MPSGATRCHRVAEEKRKKKRMSKFSASLWYPDSPSVAPSHVYFQLGCQSRSLRVGRLPWHRRAVIAWEPYMRAPVSVCVWLHVHLLARESRSSFFSPGQLTRTLEVGSRGGGWRLGRRGLIIKQKACANLYYTVSEEEVHLRFSCFRLSNHRANELIPPGWSGVSRCVSTTLKRQQTEMSQ